MDKASFVCQTKLKSNIGIIETFIDMFMKPVINLPIVIRIVLNLHWLVPRLAGEIHVNAPVAIVDRLATRQINDL